MARNAGEQLERGTGPYFYLPKLESHLEARLWADAFALSEEELGYTATRHQHEVGAGYFDLVTQTVAPDSETLALRGSTEEAQFTKEPA
jgi:hypothetical protein